MAASSHAILRRVCPYRGENPGPGKDVRESLTPGPELENDQDPLQTFASGLMIFRTNIDAWAERHDIRARVGCQNITRCHVIANVSKLEPRWVAMPVL